MRAAPASVSRPVEDAPRPNTSHQGARQAPHQAPTIKPVKPIKSSPREEKGEPKIQVIKPEPTPTSAPPERTQPTPQMRAPTPEEVAADPLVKSVLDVFEGEIKRVHPKNR